VILADSLNVVDLIDADLVLIEQPALARMETVYGDRASEGAA
jgi:ribosomal protein L4